MRADVTSGKKSADAGLRAALLRNLVEANMTQDGTYKTLTDDELLSNIFVRFQSWIFNLAQLTALMRQTFLLAGHGNINHHLLALRQLTFLISIRDFRSYSELCPPSVGTLP